MPRSPHHHALEKILSSKIGSRSGRKQRWRLRLHTNIRMLRTQMKPLHFVGTAREDLAGFPESARRRAGHELADCKPLLTGGPGAYEIRARGEAGTFRVIYVAKFKHAV